MSSSKPPNKWSQNPYPLDLILYIWIIRPDNFFHCYWRKKIKKKPLSDIFFPLFYKTSALLSCHYLGKIITITSYIPLRHIFPKTSLDLEWYHNTSFNNSTWNKAWPSEKEATERQCSWLGYMGLVGGGRGGSCHSPDIEDDQPSW